MYQLLFISICIAAAAYINRQSFTGFMRTVWGVPMPSYVIATALSILMGVIFWGIITFVLWQFKSPFL